MNKKLVDLILQNKLAESNELLESILKQKVHDILEAKKLSVFNPDRPGDIIKGLKRDAAIKLVMAHGYTLARHGAEHDIYSNPAHPEIEHKSIPIPRHQGELHVGVARKIQKALQALVPAL